MWGVLSTKDADPALLRRWHPLLSERLDGLVATGPPSTALDGWRWMDAEPAGSPLHRLLAGLRGVPAGVEAVMFLEGGVLEALAVAHLTAMLERLTADVAAVVRGAPVVDALKRVDGDRLIGTVDRTGLLTLQTPHILRRSALDEAMRMMPDGGPQDPAELLIATGHPVRIFAPGVAGSYPDQ